MKDLYIQALRGMAILAVVLIHCLPAEPWVVGMRPFLNYAVAMFVFLSGYLTPRNRISDLRSFYAKRVGKTLPPYVLWSLFYLFARKVFAPSAILTALLVGGGAAQLYYIIVYIQLLLLTPILFKMLDSRLTRIAVYAITPITLLVRYGLAISGLGSMHIASFFGSWLIFYLIGLEWKTQIEPRFERVENRFRIVLGAWIACLLLQMLEGTVWNWLGSFDMATTQLKFTSVAGSVAFIAITMLMRGKARKLFGSNRVLVYLGNISFGIYLSHMAPLMLLHHFWALTSFFGVLLCWAVVIVITCLAIFLSKRFLPSRIVQMLGFV